MSTFETRSSSRGTSYSFEMPPDETPEAEKQAVASVVESHEGSVVVPADVRVATEDQRARRAAVAARGSEAAMQAMVRVA